MPDYYQGQTNGCGTTSLAMIMSYLGIPETQGDIDGAIRRMDIFTSPTDILDFARIEMNHFDPERCHDPLAREARARVAVDRHVIDVVEADAGLAQAVLDGHGREARPMFDAAEALFLGRRDELAVDEDARGSVGVMGVDA